MMEDRRGDKDLERSVNIPQQGPEEGEHVREHRRVTDPMLPVSTAHFPYHTGLPLRAGGGENPPLLASGDWGSPGKGPPPPLDCLSRET